MENKPGAGVEKIRGEKQTVDSGGKIGDPASGGEGVGKKIFP